MHRKEKRTGGHASGYVIFEEATKQKIEARDGPFFWDFPFGTTGSPMICCHDVVMGDFEKKTTEFLRILSFSGFSVFGFILCQRALPPRCGCR